jgi:hypothetical protein
MADTRRFEPGGYRYVPCVFQYSAAVAAHDDFAIARAVLRRPVPLAEGFGLVERPLASLERPNTALAACELRSPGPLTDEGFEAFDRFYVGTLERSSSLSDSLPARNGRFWVA